MTVEFEKIPNSFWVNVALGTVDVAYEFLALKIALSRLRGHAKAGPAEASKAGEELRTLFAKYAQIPQAQRDLQNLLGKAGLS